MHVQADLDCSKALSSEAIGMSERILGTGQSGWNLYRTTEAVNLFLQRIQDLSRPGLQVEAWHAAHLRTVATPLKKWGLDRPHSPCCRRSTCTNVSWPLVCFG